MTPAATAPMQIGPIAQEMPIQPSLGLGSLGSDFMTQQALAEAMREINRKKIALAGFPQFANTGGQIEQSADPTKDRDTIPAMLTEDENVITRRGVLGLDLMAGGSGDFARGHEIIDNITRQGENYLDEVLDRPLFYGERNA